MRFTTGLAAIALAAALLPPAAASASPLPGAPGCTLFPAASPWNQRVDRLPVASGSKAMLATMAIGHLHPDFGSVYGIPWNVVDASTPRRTVTFDYDDESDRGPYPLPDRPRQEDGGDAHVLAVDRDACRLYELFAAERGDDGSWHAGSGAIFDLSSTRLRPLGWTSADAAGLPILPGLARADEAVAGEIDHALRFTLSRTQQAFLWPARHAASSITDPAVAPMGLRLRLQASYPIGRYSSQAQVVLRALKRYGMIVADNGSSGFISGDPSAQWDDEQLNDVKRVPGSALEVVDTSALPGTPRARIVHPVGNGAGRVRFLLTRRANVRIEAVRGGRVVARGPILTARQGLVTLRIDAVAGASYRVRLA